jgi:catalase
MDEKKNLDQKTTEQQDKRLTTAFGAPVADNQNTMTAGPRGLLSCKMFGSLKSWLILIVK